MSNPEKHTEEELIDDCIRWAEAGILAVGQLVGVECCADCQKEGSDEA